MSKKRLSATKKKEKESSDIIAEVIASEPESEDEFPDGFVWFASNQRWFGTYQITGEITTTGKSYSIERTGTKVDIKDMECLRNLRKEVYCRREGRNVTVAPVGKTSV